jgi:hypothetical protein
MTVMCLWCSQELRHRFPNRICVALNSIDDFCDQQCFKLWSEAQPRERGEHAGS